VPKLKNHFVKFLMNLMASLLRRLRATYYQRAGLPEELYTPWALLRGKKTINKGRVLKIHGTSVYLASTAVLAICIGSRLTMVRQN
jgi:hypothetical protein